MWNMGFLNALSVSSARFIFIFIFLCFCFLQVEDSQDLPLSAEKNDSHCPPSKLGLKRQTAAAHLRGQYQASIRQKKASQAKQKLAEQRGDANNAAFSSQPSLQTTFHPQKAYTQTLPQPYTSLQYCSSSGSHFPLSGTFAASKVCCNIYIMCI